MTVYAEKDGNRCRLTFSFDVQTVRVIRYAIPGSRFQRADQGGPAWLVPLDLTTGRLLREKFGSRLRLGPELRAWGRAEVQKERNLSRMVMAEDATLASMPALLPDLDAFIRGQTTGWPDRPYQRADIAFMAATSAINANQPRLGKTLEVIGAVYEAGLCDGAHLVIAGQPSLDSVWRFELERFQPKPVFTLSGEIPNQQRHQMVWDMIDAIEKQGGCWLITTPNMIRAGWGEIWDGSPGKWRTITIDEFHRFGLSNKKTQFFKAVKKLPAERRWALSGTPMGGIPMNLFGALQWIAPSSFTSKWRWAGKWLEIKEEEIYVKGKKRTIKEVGGIKLDQEAEFYKAHAPYMIRRLRSEVLPQLPAKLPIDVWCSMTKKQAAQYEEFAKEAEIKIDKFHLIGNNILTEYLRLKQFAAAYSTIEEHEATCPYCKGRQITSGGECWWCEGTGRVQKLKVIPTAESGKWPILLDKLEESGVRDGERAIVTSQFLGIAEFIAQWLQEHGIETALFTGRTNKRGERAQIQHKFQAGKGPPVIVMTTKTGGVSLDFGKADTVHILDETWNPDDQEQVTDRILGAYKLHQVSCFYYRSKGTIEQYIAETTEIKSNMNDVVLDVHRQRLKTFGITPQSSPIRRKYRNQ